MTALRITLATVAWAAVIAFIASALFARPEMTVPSMGVGAICALAWALLKALDEPRDADLWSPPGGNGQTLIFSEVVHTPPRAVQIIKGGKEPWWVPADDEPELPYVPPRFGVGHVEGWPMAGGDR